ncbi:MAG: redoxin domain-containing protein [Anaerolineae bacterium]|nr:redoxin domain-containing protein [Anaerolineae bacterium]
MSLLQSQKKTNLGMIIPLSLIGVGLIILGIVTTWYILSQNPDDEYSVVPSAVNFPAPELVFNDLSGNKVNLADYRQQIVMINNWATWCPPCKAEMPTLSKYFKAHNQQGFMLFGINAGDPKNDVTKFTNEFQLKFPILLDPNTRALMLFKNDSLPSSYVIDHAGNVVLAWTGPINLEMLERYVTPLMEQ